MELVGRQDMALERAEQWRQKGCGTADPARQGRAFQLDALAFIDLALAVQGKVVGVLAHPHMGQQARPGQAAGN